MRDAHAPCRRRRSVRNTAGRRHGSCAEGGMTQTPPPATSLPHHKLFAYELCLSLVKLVAKTRVADAQLRAQARKSAASAALNCAEGAARQTRADKSRAYAIAAVRPAWQSRSQAHWARARRPSRSRPPTQRQAQAERADWANETARRFIVTRPAPSESLPCAGGPRLPRRPAQRGSPKKWRGTSNESPPRNNLKSPGKTGLFSFVFFPFRRGALATSWGRT